MVSSPEDKRRPQPARENLAGLVERVTSHNMQFRADFLRSAPPTTAEGVEKYLASGMIKGIGPIYAKKLVRAFSEAVFDVIEQKPERLQEVDGIGPKASSPPGRIRRRSAIMIFLHANGVSTARAVRIFKTYGADAIRVISENPYRLARDIRGIGFKSADLITEKLGIEKTAMIRARAGIGYTLTEAMDEGHCGLPLAQLVPMAVTLLDVPTEIIEFALDLELRDGEVIADTVDGERCIFLAGLHRAERAIAARIKALSSGALTWPAIDADKAIPWVEGKAGVTLAESQREAVRLALRSKVLVIPVVPVSARPRWSTPRRATARSTPSRGISPRTTSPFSSSICTSRRRSRRRGFKLD